MEKVFVKKASLAFKQLSLTFVGVSVLVIFLLYKIAERVQLFVNVFIHKLKTACGCTQMSQLVAMHPFITATLIISSLSILIFAGFFIFKFVHLTRQTGKYHRQYLALKKANWSAELDKAVDDLSLERDGIIEINEEKPIVFCYGLFKPKVCISSGLIKLLKQDELQAVLLHESQHRLAKDPLKLFAVKLFQNAFFFLPGLKTAINKYLTYSELAADEQATDNFTDRPKLARAIFKITQAEEKNTLRDGLAASFFTSVIEERVSKLADNDYLPQFKIWGKGLAFGFFAVILTVSAAFVFLSDSTKAFEMHNTGRCGHSEGVGSACKLASAAVCGNSGEMSRQSCEVNNFSVDK